MLRSAILAVSFAFALPAFAQTAPTTPLAVSLSHDEAQAVLTLLDNAVKAGGLQSAKVLGPIADKIIVAAQVAAKADADAALKAAVDAAAKPKDIPAPTPVPPQPMQNPLQPPLAVPTNNAGPARP